MLGGSFCIALLRNIMGAGLMLAVFVLLDYTRFPIKKTVKCYVLFELMVSVAFSIWYVLDHVSYIRFSGIVAMPAVGIFCMLMSRETKYVSLYKLSLGFYLLTVTVFCGVDISRLWFHGNVWVDIVIRVILIAGILVFIIKKVRKHFLEGMDDLREELDLFSVVAPSVSAMMVALMIYWPQSHDLSVFHVVRTAFLLFMAGVIQYLVFHYYLHRGREHRYLTEKELLEMNEQLLRRQLELVRESEKESARIRHDMRHHCQLIEQYIKNQETDKLLSYVRQYEKDVEEAKPARICSNEPINSLLLSYEEYANEKNIHVTANVNVEENIAVRDIDLVAILANVLENAIHGCVRAESPEPKIHISVIQKGSKIVIQCKNTCVPDIEFQEGLPKPSAGRGIGTFSIVKVVSHYNGEADFVVKDGMFIARVLLNIPAN